MLCCRALKTLRRMSHNAIGPRDLQFPRETVLLSSRKVLSHRGVRTNLEVLILGLYVVENSRRHAFCRHSRPVIITITMRVNRDEGAMELFGYESDFILHELFEKIFCISATSAPLERVSTSELFIQQCSDGKESY